ncbi:C39 family peptidase [Haliscomenobacter sp.]|uniref:C39 family peptidase n=1 Tax=Haliscomenobacter sp. TaxID=2717303 RepID=UPI0035948180
MRKMYAFFVLITICETGFSQVQLNVWLKGQMKSNWCWAACTQMIDSFYTRSIKSQCKIVESYFGPLENNPLLSVECSHLACNDPGNLSLLEYNEPLSYYEIYQGFSRVLSNLGYYSSLEYYPNNKAWETIVDEIDHCRPLVLFIAQGTTSNASLPNENRPSHAMVIYGYREQGGDRYLLIRDPWYPSGDRCSKCNITELNFTSLSTYNNTCVIKLSGYQMNISLRSKPFCDPCEESRMPIPLIESEQSLALRGLEEEAITIPVKILDIHSNIKGSKFLPNELFDKYYPNTGKTFGYEVIDKSPVELEIKNCSYPNFIVGNFHGKSIKISYDGSENTPKYTAIYAPYPYGMKYYSFSLSSSQQTLFITDQNVFDPLNPTKILFKANEVYSEHTFNNKIGCFSKKLLKTPMLRIETLIAKEKNKFNQLFSKTTTKTH